MPSRIPTSALPCDSPAVTQRRPFIRAQDTTLGLEALVERHVVEGDSQLARPELDVELAPVLVDAHDLHALLELGQPHELALLERGQEPGAAVRERGAAEGFLQFTQPALELGTARRRQLRKERPRPAQDDPGAGDALLDPALGLGLELRPARGELA